MAIRSAWLLLVVFGCRDGAEARCRRWAQPVQVGRVSDESLDEISGLSVSARNDGLIWVHEDSGGEPTLTALSRDGSRRGTLRLTGVSNVDWEDVAMGPCGGQTCLYVGDTGDNLAVRDDVEVLRVVEPLVSGDSEFSLEAAAERFPFSYPDGPQDAEALVVTREGLPHLLTKRTDGRAFVFAFREMLADTKVELERIGELDTSHGGGGRPSSVTGASLSVDGTRLLVRTYLGVLEFDLGPPGFANLLGATRRTAPAPLEGQGEAIGHDVVRGGFLTISEWSRPRVFHVACLLDEGAQVRADVRGVVVSSQRAHR